MIFFRIALITILGCLMQEGIAKHSSIANLSSNSAFGKYQGEVFAAVPIPHNIKAQIKGIQNHVTASLGKMFFPTELSNLHITLQLIRQVNKKNEFLLIHKALISAANHNKPWNLAKQLPKIKMSNLSISKKGIVKLKLPLSDSLTNLAVSIRQSLDAFGISHSPRFDFPLHGRKNNAHITIGLIDPQYVTAARTKLKAKTFSFFAKNNSFRQNDFVVKNFVVLKSNRPAKKRHYAQISSYDL
jgi:2'-5' RNA ligase